ncbi:ABC transporter substrate-binding protein [Neptuniibacter sp.]|uniref:substrate-binding periplasmic protein n=1 Tax=Neptuniibacter sp. TaxID=1962643 RepID=UPI0026024838|nr:transporter substrate-binding domain-containing protein [Neptuniibacter sp.]MCP4596891.1 amino acid ABC transporter substrate-binding protein [Neptuniibacter sp.]
MITQATAAVLFISLSTHLTAAEQITVPTYDQQRTPLSMLQEGKARGIYPDLFQAILKEAGLAPSLVPIPPLRRRVGFENGEFELSCCANPAWRKRPLEQAVQIFSKPFYWSKDIFIFPSGAEFKIDKLSDLTDKRVATIRGFDYRGAQYFGERINFHNEKALMRALALKRADVGIINQEIFLSAPEKIQLSMGPVHDEASLHIRIHRKRLDLVEPINHAIEKIIQSGQRDKIIQRYLPNK